MEYTGKIQDDTPSVIERSPMERRTLLTTVGAVGSVGLTGCLGLGGSDGGSEDEEFSNSDVDTDDGPARFEIQGIKHPDSVRVREEFTAKIGIGNIGGEAGEFAGALVIGNPSAANNRTIGETATRTIDSGNVETFTLTQRQIPFAGEFALNVSGYTNSVSWSEGAGTSIVVEPEQVALGDPYQIADFYRATPLAVQFEDALRYHAPATGVLFGSSRDLIGLQPTVADEILAVVTVQVENTGSEQFTLEQGSLGLDGVGQLLTGFPNEDLSAEIDLEVDPLLGTTVNPGATIQGWLAYFVAREDVGDLTLQAHLNDGRHPEAIWTLTEDEVALPRFELTGMSVPERRQGPSDVFEFTVANTGDGDGTFRGATQWREAGEEDWTAYLENGQIAQIKSGEDATVIADPTDDPRGRTYEYRFRPFDARFTVEPIESS